jgi:protein ImuA
MAGLSFCALLTAGLLERIMNKNVMKCTTMRSHASFIALRRRLEALGSSSSRIAEEGRAAALPFGVPAMDTLLPGGGLALGALHEVTGSGADEEDGVTAAAFVAGILARLLPPQPVLWCLSADDLYGPGLAACGLAPKRLILMRGGNDQDVLWAMEEGLRSKALAAVVGEVAALSLPASRRLQLAAEASGTTALALRRWRSADLARRQRLSPNAAVTRWRIKALPGETERQPGVGKSRWHVALWRCRGSVPAEWMVEACDATGHVAVAAALADRPAARLRQARTG